MKKLLFALIFLMLLNTPHADAALPPLRFHVMYDGSYVKDDVFYASVLGCYSSDVLSTMGNHTNIQHPSLLIEEYNASGNCTWYPEIPGVSEIECSNSICEFYPRTSLFRFAVYIPSINRTFVSGAEELGFGDWLFNASSSGEVKISEMPLIPPIFPIITPDNYPSMVAFALVLTLAVELATSFIYLHLRKLNKKILWSVVLANIISVPLLWLLLLLVGSDAMLACLSLMAGEFAVFVFEAIVIFLLNRKRMSIVDAFAMSFVNNVASFLAGIAAVIVLGFI